jgi:nitroreductase
MVVTLNWVVTPADWERHFVAAERSNLLQSWAYGEAKANVERVDVRRALVLSDDAPVALLQVLERQIAGLIVLCRINRGPLWLASPERTDVAGVMDELRRSARWWHGRVMGIAPELSGSFNPALARQGYRRRAGPAWSSAWIDLNQPPATLRATLRSKWRNLLVAAERMGVEACPDRGDEAFEWMLARYRELREGRGFGGISEALLRALRVADQDFVVLRARLAGEWVAGILVVRHGTSATYLVGWNGPEGRRVNAHNLLLWQALLVLKASGCRWFDLGGIDDVGTPGIANFKRGLGGSEYTLAGEFISF